MTSHKAISLDTLLRLVNPDNQRVVRTIVEHLNLVEFTRTTGYVRATRREQGPDIRIAGGWVNGFTSKEEALAATGGIVSDNSVWHSPDRGSLWGATLPAHGHAWKPSQKKIDARQVCSTCHMAMPLSGACDNCA